jgi:hypothetical protein
LSELERRMSLILIQRETFPLLETQIKPGVFDVHKGTTSDLRRGGQPQEPTGVKMQFVK